MRLCLALFLLTVACDPGKGAGDAPAESAPCPSVTSSVASPSASALRVAPQRLSRIRLSKRARSAGYRRIMLDKTTEGWGIVSPLRYRANQQAVDPIIAVLAEIEIASVDPGDERMVRKHGLDPETGIEVEAWAGDRLASHFVVGYSSGAWTRVRRVGSPGILKTVGRCRPIFDKTLDELRDPVITDFDLRQIAEVSYVNEAGRLEFVADPNAPGKLLPRGAKIRNFDQDRATQNLAVLARLLAKGFVDAPENPQDTGLFDTDTPRASLLMRGPKAARVDVWVGAKTKDGRLYLRTSEDKQIFLVSGHLLSSLVPRRSHFERSDAMMRQLRAHRERRGSHGADHAGAKASAHTHTHASPPPSRVPPALLKELRAIARDQRSP